MASLRVEQLATFAVKNQHTRLIAFDYVSAHVVERRETDPATETLPKLDPNLATGNLHKECKLAIGFRHGRIRVNF